MVEIEVKFYVSHVGRVRESILAMGAASKGRNFETNICFENEDRTFRKQDILLRLRKDRVASLTFKAPPHTPDRDFKMYQELEVEVGNFEICKAILESLGFHPEQTYEKWREIFILDDTQILIDTTPYGVFLEIEGQKSAIRTVARELGLRWRERILLNYLSMFEIIRQGEGLPFKEMTFENFRSVDCRVETYLPAMYVT